MTPLNKPGCGIADRDWLGLTKVRGTGRFTIRATCLACNAHLDIGFPTQIGPNTIVPKFKHAGWLITGKNKCPSCHKPKELKMPTAPIAKPTVPLKLVDPVLSSSDAAKKVKRLVFQALEDYYDDAKKNYREGHCDKSIADEVGAAEAFVRQLREADFGPIVLPAPKYNQQAAFDYIAEQLAHAEFATKQASLRLAEMRAAIATAAK